MPSDSGYLHYNPATDGDYYDRRREGAGDYYDFYTDDRHPSATREGVEALRRFNALGSWMYGDQWQNYTPDPSLYADAMTWELSRPSIGTPYYGYDIDYNMLREIRKKEFSDYLRSYGYDLGDQSWGDVYSKYRGNADPYGDRQGDSYEEVLAEEARRADRRAEKRAATEAEAARLGITVDELLAQRRKRSAARRAEREAQQQARMAELRAAGEPNRDPASNFMQSNNLMRSALGLPLMTLEQAQAALQNRGMLGGAGQQPQPPQQPTTTPQQGMFGYSPTSNSVLNSILSSLYGNTNQQTNTATNGAGMVSNNATRYTGPFTPDQAGRAAGQPQTGGTTPMPNNTMPTRYNPYRPPAGRADGGPNDQRRTRAEQLRRSMFNGFIRG